MLSNVAGVESCASFAYAFTYFSRNVFLKHCCFVLCSFVRSNQLWNQHHLYQTSVKKSCSVLLYLQWIMTLRKAPAHPSFLNSLLPHSCEWCRAARGKSTSCLSPLQIASGHFVSLKCFFPSCFSLAYLLPKIAVSVREELRKKLTIFLSAKGKDVFQVNRLGWWSERKPFFQL